MKKIKQTTLALALLATVTFFAQTKSGEVTYEMSAQTATLGKSIIKTSFNEIAMATQINMMEGMMQIKSIASNKKDPNNTITLMEMMGKKFQITDVGIEGFVNDHFNSLKDAISVIYDKNDTKEIAGFSCYKALVTLSTGEKSNFYITEAIAPLTMPSDKVSLTGFPLEIETGEGETKVTVKAIEFNKTIAENTFDIPEGYEKIKKSEIKQKLSGL